MTYRLTQYAMLAVILSFAAWMSLSSLQFEYSDYDEPIAMGVVTGMVDQRTFNTNWSIHPVPEEFRYDQFNFSSYHMFLGTIARLIAPLGLQFDLTAVRVISMALAVAALLVTFLIGQSVAGTPVGLIATALAASSSQLYHDALYVRPEAFITLVCGLVLYFSLRQSKNQIRDLVIASILAGLVLACKVSGLPIVILPAALYVERNWQAGWRPAATMVAVSALAVLVGVGLGAPYALVDWQAYLYGVGVLVRQYANAGGPFGLRDAPIGDRFVYLLQYLLPTIGYGTSILAVLGAFVAVRIAPWRAATVMVLAIGPLFYLGTRPLFLERNFSHCLPAIYILGAIGIAATDKIIRARLARFPAAIVLTLLCAIAPAQVALEVRFDALPGNFEKRVQLFGQQAQAANPGLALLTWPSLSYGDSYESFQSEIAKNSYPLLLQLFDYTDIHSAAFIERFLHDYRASEVGRIESPFASIAPSALYEFGFRHVIFKVEGPNPPKP